MLPLWRVPLGLDCPRQARPKVAPAGGLIRVFASQLKILLALFVEVANSRGKASACGEFRYLHRRRRLAIRNRVDWRPESRLQQGAMLGRFALFDLADVTCLCCRVAALHSIALLDRIAALLGSHRAAPSGCGRVPGKSLGLAHQKRVDPPRDSFPASLPLSDHLVEIALCPLPLRFGEVIEPVITFGLAFEAGNVGAFRSHRDYLLAHCSTLAVALG